MKRPKFANGEFYHIYNRGVEKRNIFQQISDYFRFISCLYELNDKKLIKMRDRFDERQKSKYTGSTGVSREPLLEIVVFCLMPNHYHLIVRQLADGGISLFMKKLSNGYTGYFNEKYHRKGIGSLFQGRFKAVHVKNNRQLMALVCYIFTNPVELMEKNWKERGVKDFKKTIKFLKSYRWSSYLDYIGIPNFSSVTKRNFVTEFFGGPDKIQKAVEDWILYKTELNSGLGGIGSMVLD
ncbi:MAG: transposase [Candidatus Nealsonbacteria bacterium]|nr:transposase [Candidatus Nealsonbacteria bacterium]